MFGLATAAAVALAERHPGRGASRRSPRRPPDTRWLAAAARGDVETPLRSRHRKISSVTADAPTGETLSGRSDALMPGGQGGGTGPDTHVGQAEAGTAARRTSSGRALKNLRVRSRLLLLVAVPTIAAVALGGF